jgi:hypothetical protein
MSHEKSKLTDHGGELTARKLRELDMAVLVTLGIATSVRPVA